MGLSVLATKAFGVGLLVFASIAVAAGCDDPTPATPRVALSTTFGPGSEAGVNTSEICRFKTEPWIDIGDFSNRADVKYVLDGDTAGNPPGRIALVCTVKPIGDGKWHVLGNVSVEGTGSMTIEGDFTNNGEQKDIIVSWQRADTGTFQDPECTVTYDQVPMGVATGRVWGKLRCNHATLSEQSRTCLGTAEFRFENCAQQ